MTGEGWRVAGLSAAARGGLWMLLASLMFVSLDTIAKYLTQTYPVLQVTWARFTFNTVVGAAMPPSAAS